METINKNILKEVYKKPRTPEAHKRDFGKVLVVGGNEQYTGAPRFNALSALAVLKSGTDLVKVASPKRAADMIASFSPDLITIPLKGKKLKKKHIKKLLEEVKTSDSFVIGSGIGEESSKAIKKFLKNAKIPGVLDAQAIISIRNTKINMEKFILTPHANEFYQLTREKPEGTKKEKAKLVKKRAKKLNTTILLKGKEDIISNGKQIKINKTGNQYMTKGGTGDVLAGLIAGLIAQGNSIFDSACAGAYINGRAGDILKKHKKQTFLASNLIKEIEKIITRP